MNHREKLLVYPYITELEYREKIDPNKFNLILRSLQESVLRSILRGSEVNDLLRRLDLGVVTSYNALSKHVGTLLSYQNLDPGVAFASAYDSVVTTNGGNQDRVAGVVTLSWDKERKYSKVPRYDTDNDSIPDYVSPAVSVSVDGAPRSEGNNVYDMLSRKNDAFWIEQTAAGQHTIQITLPPSISKAFNYIELAPFPAFGVKISGVYYQDTSSRWNTIYDVNQQDYKFYNSSGPLVMHLEPKETNGVFKIVCEADPQLGVIGFSSMDFGLIDYRDEAQTIYLKFENVPAQTITLLSGSFDFYIDGAENFKSFITEMAIVNSTTGAGDSVSINKIGADTYTFGNETIDATNGIYLKVVMKEVNRTTPVIRGYKLNYEVT